jgi:hypothetical protein
LCNYLVIIDDIISRRFVPVHKTLRGWDDLNENADSAKVGGEKRGEVMAEEEDRVVENQRVQDNNSPSITNALGLDSPEAPNILANNSFIH